MASSFPPKDGVPPPQIPSNPPNHSFFDEEATRPSFKVPDESRHVDAQRHGFDYTESLEREIIKQRIRAEIMAEELARRRVLEQEIRMELMLEREMAMRRTESTAPSFDSHPGASQYHIHDSSIIARSLGYPEGRRLPLPSTMPVQREVGFPGFEPLPFQRRPLAAHSEPRKETILLAKPDTYISDLKQKAPISVADRHRASCTGSEKKRKRIIGLDTNPFTSGSIDISSREKGSSPVSLNKHFGGKRHRANEEALAARAQVNGESALESCSNRKRGREARLETTPVEKQSKKHKKHENADSTPNSKAKALSSKENGKSEKSTPNTKVKASSSSKNGKAEQSMPNTKVKASSSNENGKSEQPATKTKAKAPSSNKNGKSEQPMPNTKVKSLNETGKPEQSVPDTKAKASSSNDNGNSENPTPNSKAGAPSSSENGKSVQATPNTKAEAPSSNENGKSGQLVTSSKAEAMSSNENDRSELSTSITKAIVSSLSECGKSEQPTSNSEAKAPSSSENGKSEPPMANTKAKASSPNKDGKSTPLGTDTNIRLWCEMCQVAARTPGCLAEHERGKKHRRNLRKCQEAAGVAQPSVHDEVKNLETQMSN